MINKRLKLFHNSQAFQIRPPTNTILLDLFQGGTFTRASSGSYQIAAPTNGDSPFIAFADPNQRRIENRGDGLGQMLLMEGARTNLVTYSNTLTSSAGGTQWTTEGSVTGSAAKSPEGIQNAVEINTSGLGARFIITSVTSTKYAASVYSKAVSGTPAFQFLLGQTTVGLITGTLGPTWQRNFATHSADSTAEGIFVCDGRNLTAYGGLVSANRSENAYGAQMEAGHFPTSYIHTNGATATRAVDVLSYVTGTYPESFLTRGIQLDFAPLTNNVDFVSHATAVAFFTLIWFGTSNDYVAITRSGTDAVISVVAGGVTKVTSSTLTWNANQPISISANAAAGTLTISGATTGNGTSTGTAWSWPASTLYVGVSFLSTASAFGRFGQYLRGL